MPIRVYEEWCVYYRSEESARNLVTYGQNCAVLKFEELCAKKVLQFSAVCPSADQLDDAYVYTGFKAEKALCEESRAVPGVVSPQAVEIIDPDYFWSIVPGRA